VLCGLKPGSFRLTALARALAPRFRLGLGPTCVRYCASLEGGLDGFLARRSANFRVSLKRARRRAAERGLTIEPVWVGEAEVAEAFERLLAVEAQSWKGRSGVGFAHSEMLGFYRVMLPRLARRGAMRLMFARHEGRDIGYILGGLRGTRYRGLQFSFAEGWEDCSPGNLCQLAQIAALCDEGIASYDLGADVEYKRRWGEREEPSVTLIAAPQ
jgi:CelD/BcsL family acetyltransferase involved in cellulose biosynthesis